MSNSKIHRVKYFTKEKKALISEDNLKLYDKYLKSNIIKNKDVKNTTYLVYKNYMTQFLVYIAEEWDNINLYSEDFYENAIDIMEGFMSFCMDTLHNHKKIINTKISAVSSFYLWSMKRRLVKSHPFANMLDRMKKANEEKIINAYFLTDEQIEQINKGLVDEKNNFDLLDIVLWHVMLDSANRIGAIDRLTLSQLDLENCAFTGIREKEGYIVDVAFTPNTKEIILKWLELRKQEMDALEIDALFISKYEGKYRKMNRSTLQRRIRKIGTIIGLEDFHAHCIRKTSSNSLLSKGVDVSLVQKFLNHKDPSTTLTYYSKPSSSSEIRNKIMDKIKEFNSKNNKKSK